MKEFFRSAFTVSELISSSTVNVIQGQFVKLGEYTVKAGEVVALGYGRESGQENAQGRAYMKLQDNTGTPVQLHGIVRLSIYSPQDRPIEIMHEYRTETLDTSATDRTKQIPFPVYNGFVSEDKKIVLEFKSDTTAVLDKTDCKILIDVTKGVV